MQIESLGTFGRLPFNNNIDIGGPFLYIFVVKFNIINNKHKTKS